MPFTARRGTNISHWLSQSKRRGEERRSAFTRDDVHLLRDAGLDHLRIPVDEEHLWNSGDVGEQTRDNEGFDLLHAALDWCAQAGLNAIVDLHILRSHFFLDKNPPLFTDKVESERFGWFWQELSKSLGNRSEDGLAYELMNEAVAVDHGDWNRVYPYALQSIRSREPTRTVVLGSNRWNQCWTSDALDVPPEDKHLILTFHFYNPMLVTHYGASWAEKVKDYTGPIHYPGRPIDDQDWSELSAEMKARLADENQPYGPAEMERELAKPLAVAARTSLPLYCGEFGVIATVPDETRAAWYRDFRTVLEKHNIGWGNWDYRGDFGLLDRRGNRSAAWTGLLG